MVLRLSTGLKFKRWIIFEQKFSDFFRGLRERDLFSRTTNPVCVLYMKSRGSRQWKEVGRTEKVENSLDPEWTKTFEIEYYFEEKQVSRTFKRLFG